MAKKRAKRSIIQVAKSASTRALIKKLIRSPVRIDMIMLIKDRPPMIDASFGLAPIANATMMLKAGKPTLDR
mgnify:CR=1 FL=1